MMGSDRLGGVPPVTAFTGLPGTSQLTAILITPSAEEHTFEWIHEKQQHHFAAGRISLGQMHQTVDATSTRRNAQARARHAKKQGVKMAHFAVGDFVLWRLQLVEAANLLFVDGDLNGFDIQGLCVPYPTICSLTFYMAKADIYSINRSTNLTTRQWGIFDQWIGLNPDETSWEPASVSFKDVATLVQQFVEASDPDSPALEMWIVIAPALRLAEQQKTRRRRRSTVSRRIGGSDLGLYMYHPEKRFSL
ncbi:LOW QUALITY PROTEIN: hypothetical protein PHMEG_0005855 [Phytophthora megakarya]|uniref:Chromo domain-containing protein n=1 Tax=Phytophthora megakarya TaxID=4795 RepID=A0A225WRN7_9STRA|nr:LOW QUALITY PROTEIN: hypothetical protein PHMEG_0005855 [Phytophthora megakarya]